MAMASPDIVAADFSANGATVLLGDGMGGFTAALFAAGTNPSSVAVADFNRREDGYRDCEFGEQRCDGAAGRWDGWVRGSGGKSVCGGCGLRSRSQWAISMAMAARTWWRQTARAASLTVLLGDGTGGFAAAEATFALGRPPSSVAVGDVNNDGKQDLVASTTDGEAAVLYGGDGAGGFGGLQVLALVGSIPEAVALADLNHDGNLDIVTANSGDNTVGVLLGDGAGGFNRARGQLRLSR